MEVVLKGHASAAVPPRTTMVRVCGVVCRSGGGLLLLLQRDGGAGQRAASPAPPVRPKSDPTSRATPVLVVTHGEEHHEVFEQRNEHEQDARDEPNLDAL